MSESYNFQEREAEFGHDFKALSSRLRQVYEQLDELAHADGSEHDDEEIIYIEAQLGEVSAVFCEKDKLGRMHVRSQDEEGRPISEYWCNIVNEAPKHRAEADGGKHLADEPPPHEKAEQPALSQIDSMVVMVSVLELGHQALVTQQDATILAHEK